MGPGSRLPTAPTRPPPALTYCHRLPQRPRHGCAASGGGLRPASTAWRCGSLPAAWASITAAPARAQRSRRADALPAAQSGPDGAICRSERADAPWDARLAESEVDGRPPRAFQPGNAQLVGLRAREACSSITAQRFPPARRSVNNPVCGHMSGLRVPLALHLKLHLPRRDGTFFGRDPGGGP